MNRRTSMGAPAAITECTVSTAATTRTSAIVTWATAPGRHLLGRAEDGAYETRMSQIPIADQSAIRTGSHAGLRVCRGLTARLPLPAERDAQMARGSRAATTGRSRPGPLATRWPGSWWIAAFVEVKVQTSL